MRIRRHALAHQHARPRRRLKHIIDALDLERAALLVRARADRLRDPLCLLARDEVGGGGRGGAFGRPEVGLAPHEEDRDLGAAY